MFRSSRASRNWLETKHGFKALHNATRFYYGVRNLSLLSLKTINEIVIKNVLCSYYFSNCTTSGMKYLSIATIAICRWYG